ncbi:MAG TPA: hypothetical protein VMZ92_13920 [Planctomycetota bacterium]|nr:hypothetical protein [Planctomycetota bacterium]
MGYPTSAPTLYLDKPTADLGLSGSKWEHPDANVVKARIIELSQRGACTQSISVHSNGTTTFTPTFPGKPLAVAIMAKNSTAGTIFAAGYHVSNMTTSGISIKHDTHTKKGSAYATVFY